MEVKRKERYEAKADLALERLSNVREWYAQSDQKSRLAAYKAFQEMAEAISDLCAMACKDNGKLVKDDYANIESIKTLKLIDPKLAEALNEINGMRNRVVHEYNCFSYQKFSGSIGRLLSAAEKFLKEISGWARQK